MKLLALATEAANRWQSISWRHLTTRHGSVCARQVASSRCRISNAQSIPCILRRSATITAIGAFTWLFARVASAENTALVDRKPPRQVYLLAGGPVGVTTQPGFVIGGELSIACWGCIHLTDLSWFGAYVDVLRDFGVDEFRGSVGPEFGFGPIGVDGGLLVSRDSNDTDLGWTARALITSGIVGVYGRYLKFPGEPRSGEFGVLLKYHWRL